MENSIIEKLCESEETRSREYLETLAAVIRKTGGIYNNHTDKIEKIGGLVLLRKGEVAAWFGGGSSLNKAYYSNKDGIVHVSTWSIGGTVQRGSEIPNQEDIDLYNKSLMPGIVSCTIDDFVTI